MKKLLIFLSFILQIMAVWAVPFVAERPVIDGKLTDAVWKKIPWKSGFSTLGTNRPAPVQTRFKTFNNGKYIYFAVECDEPEVATIVREPYQNGSRVLWTNDTIEINLIPDNKLLTFYKCLIDVNGNYTDLIGQDDNTDSNRYVTLPWQSGIVAKTALLKNKWIVEAAIPFGSMDYNVKNTDQWRLNIGRNRWKNKTVELSGWSVLPEANHVMPKSFRGVTVEKFSPANFLLDVENVKGNIIRRNGKQNYQVSVSVYNNSPMFRIYQLTCTLTDIQNGRVYSGTVQVPLQKLSYKRESVLLPEVPNGNYILTVDLNSNSRNPVLLKRFAREVNIEYIPLQIKMKRPAYRNNLYASMPDKTIEAQIELNEFKGAPVFVTLTGNGVNVVRKIEKSSGKDIVFFDGEKLPDGRYILKASLLKDGKELSASVKIRKLPYRKGEVWLDQRGVMHIDGKEFLSYGWYHHHAPRDPIYNTLVETARFKNMEEAEKTVAKSYQKYGLKSLVYPFQDLGNYTDWRWVIFKDPDTRKKGLTGQQREKIMEFVSRISHHEGLVGYYMADEPEARANNPIWYEEALELISEIDPYHPCFMLNYGIDGMRKYYKGCDILFPDCYPQYFEDSSTGSPRWKSSDYAKAASALRPFWLMPQISQFPELSRDGKLRGIAPTYYDQRSQIFQALIHNAKGISNYTYFDSQRFSDAILGPPEIGKILLKCTSYFLENSVPNGVKVVTSPHLPQFQAGLKIHQGKLCLLAVNTSLQNVRVEFALQNSFTGKLYLESARKSVEVVNGKFTDVFAPNETRIYFSDKVLAGSLASVDDTVNAIAELRKSRKKPGNLAGVGEMYPIEYTWYGMNKKLAPGIPLITASSDSRHYMTRKTGSLYFLVDGLTVPNRPEYNWSPENHDKNPFVQIKLAEASNLKMVKLYTWYGNLKAGRIVVNGKKFPFVNSSGRNEISVPLNGIYSDTVRIECTEFRTEKLPEDDFGFSAKVLSEVEIY